MDGAAVLIVLGLVERPEWSAVRAAFDAHSVQEGKVAAPGKPRKVATLEAL